MTFATLIESFIMNIIKRRKQGFTLIEMLMVIAVLGVLMTVLFVSLRGTNLDDRTNQLQLKSAKVQLEAALFQYRQTFGNFPATGDGLRALVEPIGVSPEKYPSGGFLLNKNALLDPWKHPYQYELTSDGSYRIFSLGSDKQLGGEGSAADIDLSELE